MDYVATAEVARRLGITPRHVARLVVAGDLAPAVRAPGVRGAMLFTPAEVDAYAARRPAVAGA